MPLGGPACRTAVRCLPNSSLPNASDILNGPFTPCPQPERFAQIKNLIHSFSPPPGVPESSGNDALSNVQVQLCIWKEILTSFRKKNRPHMTLSSWREILTCVNVEGSFTPRSPKPAYLRVNDKSKGTCTDGDAYMCMHMLACVHTPVCAGVQGDLGVSFTRTT